MQTQLADFIKDTPEGREADTILRSCVHCGFCTATCPTYQLLGDELDGPRGRIYLIKQLLEGQDVTAKTQLHLDRCLTCRSCETTCPSGVNYHRLADIGRKLVAERVGRPLPQRLLRWGLRTVIPYPRRFAALLRLGQSVRGLLPRKVKASVPAKQLSGAWPTQVHSRRMIVLDGCVQPAISPDINAACARVLDRVGISLVRVPQAGCCGAVSYHLDAHEEGLNFMRRMTDSYWQHLQNGCEAIVVTASGCGSMIKEYGHLLAADPQYAEKAAAVSAACKDIGEVLSREDLSPLKLTPDGPVAFHCPCSLQHGQQLTGVVEALLTRLGFSLTPVKDPHLCCGSAGTYSILQPELAGQLRANKLAALSAGQPATIATANIGCLTHLQGDDVAAPVRHWIEVVDRAAGSGRPAT